MADKSNLKEAACFSLLVENQWSDAIIETFSDRSVPNFLFFHILFQLDHKLNLKPTGVKKMMAQKLVNLLSNYYATARLSLMPSQVLYIFF